MNNFFKQSTNKKMSLLITKGNESFNDKPEIVFIGDSNMEISYFKTIPEKKFPNIVAEILDVPIVNMALNGRSTFDYLKKDSFTGDDHKSEYISYNAHYYIICFGLNDEKYISLEEFEKDTKEIINVIRNETDGTPILMTNVWVDYPDHYSNDRNNLKIKPYDDVKRKLSKEMNIYLIDAYERFKKEYENNGIWDTRIRTSDLWDDSQDEGKTVGAPDYWWNNIHYNVLGNEIVADEIIKFFKENKLTILN